MLNPDSPITPARYRYRLAGFLLDYLVISAYIIVLVGVGLILLRVPLDALGASLFSSPARADLTAFLVLVLPVVLYFAILESRLRGATWGKSRLGIRVTNLAGGRVDFGQALLRNLLKFLPWQIAHTCLFNIPGWPLNPQSPPAWVYAGFALVWLLVLVYALAPLFNPRRRTPYDWAAGTLVVVPRVQPQHYLEGA